MIIDGDFKEYTVVFYDEMFGFFYDKNRGHWFIQLTAPTMVHKSQL